ncbi:ATPase (AAA+ superfamily)-like protein [Sulfobacillus acidophilus TPY]|uniref:ATPase (AAA+ superfamily)-like protein n=1 Tax=Sulfobacillus acidophilus (strain ATCC 700253 / DSM 10332 / NAL) TaxID=679936 RepID=G8TVJ8_SULAD|nr:ATPase (AAA+ superfamily)-like protein [Sulfobacillus acidophilus TPY]AEW03637.1 ATPase (AAA+ superfamily)-like protein [Sulfobacillus acidophilus DSM 10332]
MGIKVGAVPHAYLLKDTLTDADFAADLMRLYRNEAPPVYQDPTVFLKQTFPTEGLRDTLKQVFGRIAHVPGSASVIRLETAFGGGKTHVMSTIYHVARDGHRLRSLVRPLLDEALIPSAPVKTVVLVGDKYSGNHCMEYAEDGIETHTLWGELAYQVGGKEAWNTWKAYDEERMPPSDAVLHRLLSGSPVVLLMDELPAYLRTARSVTVGHTTLAGVTIPFMQRLLTLAASLPNLVVVYSLAREAYADEAEELLRELDAVSARVETVIRPTGDTEVAAIVNRRLFASVDPAAAENTADRFIRYYQSSLGNDMPLPAEYVTPAYREALIRSYPFHPALLDVLDRKVATIPDFNKTRGALRVLADTVQALWEGDDDPDLILPGMVPVSDVRVQPQLTSRIKREVFTHALRADLANDQGDAHAQLLDRSWIGRTGRPLVSHMARTAYLHSLVQGKASGATLTDLLIGAGSPGVDLGLCLTAWEEFMNAAWYVVSDGRLFRFQTEPSLNKVIADEMTMVHNQDVRAELVAKIQQVFQDGAFKLVYNPDESVELEDRPSLRLVVTSPDGPLLDLRTTGIETPAIPDRIRDLFENHGGDLRKYRNSLVFLLADEGMREDLYRLARRLRVIRSLVEDPLRKEAFASQWDRLIQEQKSGPQELSRAIYRTYRHLFYPDGSANGLAYRIIEPHQDDFPKGKGQHMIERALRERPEGPKLLVADDPPKDPDWLKERAWDYGRDEITTEALYHAFFRRGQLPFLAAVDPLKESIRQAVEKRLWVYRDGDRVVYGESVNPVISSTVWLYTAERAKNLGIGPWQPGTDESAAILTEPEKAPGRPAETGYSGGSAKEARVTYAKPVREWKTTGTVDEVIRDLADADLTEPVAIVRLAAVQLAAVNALTELSTTGIRLPVTVDASFLITVDDEEIRLDFKGSVRRFQRVKTAIVPFVSEAMTRNRPDQNHVSMTLTYDWDADQPTTALVDWLRTALGKRPGTYELTVGFKEATV